MTTNLEDQLIDKVRALPPSKQQEALRLLDNLARSEGFYISARQYVIRKNRGENRPRIS